MRMKFGYSRISTSDQSLNPQDDQLRKEGCERIFSDIASGAQEERSALKDLLSHARKGDVVVVVKLDRLGRSLKHLIEIVGELEKEGIGLKSLSEGIDTTTSGGKLVFHIFGAIAEFERALIIERTQAGLTAARARGRKGGRPKALSSAKVKTLLSLAGDRTLPVGEICRTLNIGRDTYYRYLREHRKETPKENTTKP